MKFLTLGFVFMSILALATLSSNRVAIVDELVGFGVVAYYIICLYVTLKQDS